MGILDQINNPQYIEVKITKESIVDAFNYVLGTNLKVKDIFGDNKSASKITNVFEDEKNNTNHIGRNPLRGMSK